MARPRLHSAPGQTVDVGGHRLHVRCTGAGSPTVVLESALGGSSLSWSLVQPDVAGITRACCYDRAGFGWSDAGPLPRTAGRMASELRALLAQVAVPPFVLVGHSYGALVVRIFAARHPADTAGLVFVEPAFPEDWIQPNESELRRVDLGVTLCRRGEAAARFGVARLVARLVSAGAPGLARALAGLVGQGALGREHEEILAPIWKLSAGERRLLASMWTRPEFFQALGSQIATIQRSAEEVRESGGLPGDVPLVVVSAAAPHPHHVTLQERLAGVSSRGRRIVAPASGHWVPLDQPEVVVRAVREIVDEVRRVTGAAPPGAGSPGRNTTLSEA